MTYYLWISTTELLSSFFFLILLPSFFLLFFLSLFSSSFLLLSSPLSHLLCYYIGSFQELLLCKLCMLILNFSYSTIFLVVKLSLCILDMVGTCLYLRSLGFNVTHNVTFLQYKLKLEPNTEYHAVSEIWKLVIYLFLLFFQ